MGFSLISGAEILFHFLASICKENGKELSESQKDVEIAVSEADKDGSGKQNIPSPIPIMFTGGPAFFYVGPPKESIFLTTNYGLYFSHQYTLLGNPSKIQVN